jgi:hypothetical protein
MFGVKNFLVKGQNDLSKVKVFKIMLWYLVPKNIKKFFDEKLAQSIGKNRSKNWET